MGPWACVSVCQAAWSTDGHAEAHLCSPVVSRQDIGCFVDFLCIFQSDSVLTFFLLTFWILCFLLSVFFFFFSPPDRLISCSPEFISTLPFPLALFFLFPVFHRSLSPCAWFLGYALLTHCDSPALWTACLPTDNHMLPQLSAGKHSPSFFI